MDFKICDQMLLQMNSMSSELTGAGCDDSVVADSASELPDVLFFRSEEEDDAVDGSLVAPGVAPADAVVKRPLVGACSLFSFNSDPML